MTPHNSPVRARYGVSFVDSTSALYSASVSAMIYAISCYIGLRYIDTRLYFCVVYSYISYRWLSARLQYLQCISNGYIAVLHLANDMPSLDCKGRLSRFEIVFEFNI